MNNDDIILTVLVVTYNHSQYISRALDSVVSQKTDYGYEIIVHDDASTDGTTDILKCYEREYPEIIKLALEESNQYSKGTEYLLNAMKQLCHRKYVIILEGDDYWCNESKLQKQLDYMEAHPESSGTTHRCDNVQMDEKGNLIHVGFSPKFKDNNEWNIAEIIDWSDAPHTTSFLFKTELFRDMPESILRIKAGDWRNMVWACAHGLIHYSNEVMSIHEQFVKGSYSSDNFSKGVFNDYENLLKSRQEWCDTLDGATGYKYHDMFRYSQDRRWGEYLWNKGEYRNAARYKAFFRKKGLKKRVVMMLLLYLPGFERVYSNIICKHNGET